MNSDWLNNPALELDTEGGFHLTELMCLVRDMREDLKGQFPLGTRLERTAYALWFLSFGQDEFEFDQSFLPHVDWQLLQETCQQYAPLSKLQAALWLSQPELRSEFDLSRTSERDIYELASSIWPIWPADMPAIVLSDAMRIRAARASESVSNDLSMPITELMYSIWRMRSDLQTAFPLDSRDSRARFLLWFLVHGRREYDLSQYDPAVCKSEYLHGASTLGGTSGLSRLMHLVWLADSNLQQSFSLDDNRNLEAFASWFANEGVARCGLVDSQITGQAESPRTRRAQRSGTGVGAAMKGARSCDNPGINVIGSVYGDYGLGHMARMTLKAAVQSDVPGCLVNLQPKTWIHGSVDLSPYLVLPEPRFDTNVFVTLPSVYPYALRQDNLDMFDCRYNIFYLAWELELLPESWRRVISSFHEAWGLSGFVADALRKALNMPVVAMPLAVEAQVDKHYSRAEYGLASGDFVFLYVFDAASSIARKNPGACIDAFMKAFTDRDEKVRLVLKTRHLQIAHQQDPIYVARLLERSKLDSRIVLIDCEYDRAQTMCLLSLCDAYISLHRCEGFGFTIAEAMLHGKPVIATNYSGNTDFTLQSNSCLVNFSLKPIETPEYPHWEQQYWAEPDIDHAANHMRRLFCDRNLGRTIGEEGRRYIAANHSPRAVGAKIASRLCEVRAEMKVLR